MFSVFLFYLEVKTRQKKILNNGTTYGSFKVTVDLLSRGAVGGILQDVQAVLHEGAEGSGLFFSPFAKPDDLVKTR